NVFDKSQLRINGAAQQIESTNISPTQTSFTPTAAFQPGGNYSINLQVIQSRDGKTLPSGSGNSDVLTRSSSFFDFTPPASGTPAAVALPQVAANGVYSFQVGSVGPSSTTFIDPAIAIGYKYAVGPGDPNFASVTLPTTGGGKFTVTYQQGGQTVSTP